MKGMPLKLKLYTLFIIGLGLVCLLLGVQDLGMKNMSHIIFFTVLAIVAEAFNIRIKGATAVSVNFAIGLATVLLFKPQIAALIGFFSMVLYIEYEDGRFNHLLNSSMYKRFFNGSAYAISLFFAGIVYNFIDKNYPYFRFLHFSTIGIIGSILVYIIINSSIFMNLMALLEKKSILRAFEDNRWAMINLLALSPFGVITAITYNTYGWFAVVLFFGPLLLARYSFKLYMDMRHIYFETIKALSNAMEAKDQYTNGHSYRVAEYAVKIGEQMGLRQDKIEKIKTAAILHDIGKIGIADDILNKPGKLEDDEYNIIKSHPEIGAQILSGVDFLRDVTCIIKYHHERFDGKGYPSGICGGEIPIEAAILAVADTYDAMTSDRPYRKAMDSAVAINIISKESGYQFNPVAVKAFCEYMKSGEERIINVC